MSLMALVLRLVQVWATQQCSLGWSVQGIWPAQADGCDVLSCDVNFATEHGDKVAATGDNFGRIRLFKYPVQSSYAIYRCHYAHSGQCSELPSVPQVLLIHP